MVQDPEMLGKLANAEINVTIELRDAVVGPDINQVFALGVSHFVETFGKNSIACKDLNPEPGHVIFGFIRESNSTACFNSVFPEVKCHFPDRKVIVGAIFVGRIHVYYAFFVMPISAKYR